MNSFFFMISVTIPCVWGVFDDRDGVGHGGGSQFQRVTSDLLQCAEDSGVPLRVELNVTNPGDVFKPLTSKYVIYNDYIYRASRYI